MCPYPSMKQVSVMVGAGMKADTNRSECRAKRPPIASQDQCFCRHPHRLHLIVMVKVMIMIVLVMVIMVALMMIMMLTMMMLPVLCITQQVVENPPDAPVHAIS